MRHIQFLNCDVCKDPTPDTQVTNLTRTVVMKTGVTVTINHKHCDQEECKKEASVTLKDDLETIMGLLNE